MPIVTYPSETLRKQTKTQPCDSVEVVEAIEEMKRTIVNYPNAVGIAAPQVGYNVRAFMMKDTSKNVVVMINPIIIKESADRFISEEGCLSLPKIKGRVSRNWKIIVVYCDEQGIQHQVEYTGLDAAIVQHEIDHLDGVLFSDYLSGGALKRAAKHMAKLSKGAK